MTSQLTLYEADRTITRRQAERQAARKTFPRPFATTNTTLGKSTSFQQYRTGSSSNTPMVSRTTDPFQPRRVLDATKAAPREFSRAKSESGGIRCFKCNEAGHVAKECPKPSINEMDVEEADGSPLEEEYLDEDGSEGDEETQGKVEA